MSGFSFDTAKCKAGVDVWADLNCPALNAYNRCGLVPLLACLVTMHKYYRSPF